MAKKSENVSRSEIAREIVKKAKEKTDDDWYIDTSVLDEKYHGKPRKMTTEEVIEFLKNVSSVYYKQTQELESENKVIRETNKRLNKENEKLKSNITDSRNKISKLEKEIVKKDKIIKKRDNKYKQLHDKLYGEIGEFKSKLKEKDNKIGNLEIRVRDYETVTFRARAEWKIETLEDENHAYFASWWNPSTKEVEGYYIPIHFNPHHILDLNRDKYDFYTVVYGDENDVFDIKIPVLLFEKLKQVIQPRKKKTVNIEDLTGILQAKNIHKKLTPKMKLVWSEIIAKKEITVAEISKNADVSRETIYKYLEELFLKEDLVLKRGSTLKVHPSILDLTKI